MKVWIKYIIGCVFGILVSLVISFDSATSQNILSFCTEFALRFGRYIVLPLLFFGMTVAVCKLRTSSLLLKTATKAILIIVISAFCMTLLGLITALIFKIPRIPIPGEKETLTVTLNLKELILKMFPYSTFEVFTDGVFLVPLFVLAAFAGAGFASDMTAAKPAMTLFDSLAKVSYSIMCFFVDMLSIGLIAISCTWTLSFIKVINQGVFTNLLILLSSLFLIIVLGIYPLVLKFGLKESNPYKLIYACVASMIASFFSGDSNLSLPIMIRHIQENLGVKRRISGVTVPLFYTFGHCGSALVSAVSFVVILNSYNALGISFTDVLWITGTAFGLSFLLSGLPVGGTFVAITVMCSFYGRGFDAGYLLLKPVAGIICSFATALNTLTTMLGTYIIASKGKFVEHKDVHKFI